MPIRERAVDFSARLLEALRDEPDHLCGAGPLHLDRGALGEAEDRLRRAVARSPDLVDVGWPS